MSLIQESSPIPRINYSKTSTPSPPNRSLVDTPLSTSSSVYSRSPSHSPSRDATNIKHTTPATDVLLRTPSPSESTSYFTQRGSRSAAPYARTTPPSGTLSTPSCLSPGGSSGGSSDVSHIICSQSTGSLLSPPRFPADSDIPPYKPQDSDDRSLTMANLRRVTTVLHGKGRKTRRKHHKNNRCRHKKANSHELKDHSAWSHNGCQTAPTAAPEQRHLCKGHVGHRIPFAGVHGTTDTYGNSLYLTNSGTSQSGTELILARRWSSVEIGTHQVHLEPILPSGSVTTEPAIVPVDEQPYHVPLDKRYRSSTFTRGAIDHDIVRAIRDTLTSHALPLSTLETPSSITLRRASAVGSRSGLATAVRTPSHMSGGTTPLVREQCEERRMSTAYIITGRDIDSITELVQANLKRNYRIHDRTDMNTTSEQGYQAKGKKRTKLSSLVLPSKDELTIEQPNNAAGSMAASFLQVLPASSKQPEASPTKSVHEIIWEGGNLSPSIESVIDDSDQNCSSQRDDTSDAERHDNSPGFGGGPAEEAETDSPHSDKGDAFDPSNASASINEWSWKCPQHEIALVVTSSDSESSTVTPRTEAPRKGQSKSPLKGRRSDSRMHQIRKHTPPPQSSRSTKPSLTDVVSFPPLPTRSTNDWISPLPPMDSPPHNTSKSLYELGLDVNCGPTASISSSFTTLRPSTSWIRSTESSSHVSRNSSVGFDPNYQIRRKSTLKIHPKANPRIGAPSAMGSALGSSSGERRKSSVKNGIPGIKRVRTIDNKHKGERVGTWNRVRPPSICPPLKSSSAAVLNLMKDTGLESDKEAKTSQTQTQTQGRILDRLRLICKKSPSSPKPDHANIFGRLTGTGKSDGGASLCQIECQPHDCDDCAADPRTPSIDWIR